MAAEDICVGAPTGKAAVRINQGLTAARIPLRAKTWHSHLGVGEPDPESGAWSFQFNASNPWPFRIIIADEESMKDTSMMCSVMAARPRGCHFLLVGDIYQLPPVGSGAPLRDLIAAGCRMASSRRSNATLAASSRPAQRFVEGRPWTGARI